MFDKDLPAFMFVCSQCQKQIPDLDHAVAEPIAKGSGFSSMKMFCDNNCADATAVEAALLTMDGDELEQQVDVNGDVVYPSDSDLDDMRLELLKAGGGPVDTSTGKDTTLAGLSWSAWVKGVSKAICADGTEFHAIYDIDEQEMTVQEAE